MDEKTFLYNIIMDVWHLMKKHVVGKVVFSDDDWTNYIDDMSERGKKYYGKDRRYIDLYEGIINLVDAYILATKKKEMK